MNDTVNQNDYQTLLNDALEKSRKNTGINFYVVWNSLGEWGTVETEEIQTEQFETYEYCFNGFVYDL